jgi:hemerythrin-like domain-containing protein
VCGHCGCHGVDAIRELKSEHDALVDEAEDVRRALAADDRTRAVELMKHLVDHLGSHVHREERGIFTAMREKGEFVDEVEALEGEHVHLDAGIEELDPDGPDFEAKVAALFRELEEHIEREDLGIFPASVVTLGAAGWETVEQAHADIPTFLPERSRA